MTLLFLYSSYNKYYRYYYNFWGSSIGYWEKNDEQKTIITHQLYPSLIRIHNNNNSGCYRLLSLSSSSSSFIIIINEYLLLMLLLCYVWLAVSATLLCVHSLCYVTDIIRLQNVKQEWTELYVSMYLCVIWMGKNFISSQQNENNNNKKPMGHCYNDEKFSWRLQKFFGVCLTMFVWMNFEWNLWIWFHRGKNPT